MSVSPPPLPSPTRNLRAASAINVILPGAGLFYLGHRRSGGIIAGLFLACFVVALGTFLVGYVNYLSVALDPQILEGNRLEEIGASFHQGWLMAFALLGAILYLVSTVLFMRAKRQFAAASSP